MLENLSRDQFAEQLNTTFDVYFADDAATPTTLIEVTELRQKPPQESFSLFFLAPVETPVLQQQFKVEHPALGSFELFLVPIGMKENGLEYQAVFNRMIV